MANVVYISLVIFVLLVGIVLQLFLLNSRNPRQGSLPWRREEYDIVIGILSAREKFEHRSTVRNNWIQLLNSAIGSVRITYRFIIGSEGCGVPALDRITPYGCEWDSYLSLAQDSVSSHNLSKFPIPGNFFLEGNIGFDFEVLHDILLVEVGVFDDLGDGINGSIEAALYDTRQKEKVLTVVFGPSDPGHLMGPFRMKATPAVLLPKGFLGTMVFGGFGKSDLFLKEPGTCMTHDGEGLIRLNRGFRFGILPSTFPQFREDHHENLCAYFMGTMHFKPSGSIVTTNASTEAQLKSQRYESHESASLRVSRSLQDEFTSSQDILFVDCQDTYRNLPMKMKLFAEWVSRHLNVSYVIKTDDDCFLNVPNIVRAIQSKGVVGQKMVWWGRFRYNWPLDNYGKWEERDYLSSTYPAFACGGGNLLSSDLIEWIANNTRQLKVFQGEDVSLGIWLAAVGPKLIDDYHWQCVQHCSTSAYAIPNNSLEELKTLYTNYRLCGNPCGCNNDNSPSIR